MSGTAEVQAMAKVLYVAANWQEAISEPDGSTKPQSEYERRAAEKWDDGTAGWSNYQRYPRYAAALSAAGFGDVREAGAVALEGAARDLSWFGAQGNLVHPDTAWAGITACMNTIRARAAAVRGEG